MRKWQSVRVFKSTNIRDMKRRLQFTLHVPEEGVLRMIVDKESVPHFTEEQIREIEKQLNDEYCKLYNIDSLRSFEEVKK